MATAHLGSENMRTPYAVSYRSMSTAIRTPVQRIYFRQCGQNINNLLFKNYSFSLS